MSKKSTYMPGDIYREGSLRLKFDRVETPAIRWLNAVYTEIRTVVASSTLTRASQPDKSPLAGVFDYTYIIPFLPLIILLHQNIYSVAFIIPKGNMVFA
jgi:hypothetical protein